MQKGRDGTQTLLEGECYLKTRADHLKKCWGVLIGHDFYCYTDS